MVGLKHRLIAVTLACVAALMLTGLAEAAEQVVTPSQTSVTLGPNQSVTLAISYSTANPQNETLTGLGLRVHFDSTKLAFVGITNRLATSFFQQDPAPQTDSGNLDADASTDMSFNVAWTDFGGMWPGVGTTPAVLYRVTFTTAANFAGSTTVRFSGNTAAGYTFSSTPVVITAADTTPPVITLVGAATINITTGSTFTDPGATASDNKDGNVTASIVRTGTVNSAAAGTYTLTYNVRDVAGNAATPVTRTVIVTDAPDTTPPVITLVGAATINIVTGSVFTDPGATASDNKDGNISANIVRTGTVNTATPGTYVLTYNVRDAAGNAATAVTRTVIVANPPDTTPPVITLVGAATINIVTGSVFTDPGATASDNKDGNISANIVRTGTVNVATPGTYVLTYNVRDAAGNAATAVTRTVIVANPPDTTPPVITLVGAATINITTGSVFTDPGATASDNKDGNITANIVRTGTVNVATAGSYVLTYNVRDAAGNAATAVTRTVVVANPPDTTPPVITLVGAATINTTTGIVFTDPGATASDNKDGNVTASIVRTGAVNTATPGTYVLTYNVRDAAGNAAVPATRSVVVTDATPPVLTIPASAIIEIEGPTGVPKSSAQLTAFLAGASATDAVDGAVPVTNNAPVTFPFGTTTVTFTARDAANNAATRTATVRVDDTRPPTLTVPSAVTVEITSPTGTPKTVAAIATFLAGATSTDVRDGNVTVTNNAPATLPFGATSVTFTATDAAGNVASASRTITIVDTTPPTVTPPTSITVELENAAGTPRTSAQLAAFVATAADLRDGAVTPTNDAPATFPLGATTVTFRATDVAGNASAPRTAVVTVADRTPPTLTLVGANPTHVMKDATFADPGFTATDLRDGNVASRVVVTGSVDTSVVGTYTLTYKVSDASANAAVPKTRSVIVELGPDTTSPEVSAPAKITVQAEGPSGAAKTNAAIAAFIAAATATDDRDGVRPVTNNAPASFPFGSTTVTFTASDTSNNTGSASAVVMVVDTTGPVLTIPSDITVDATGRLTQVDIRSGTAAATDAVDGARTPTITGRPANDNFPTGRTVITYTAEDAAHNIATRDQVINVNPLAQLGPSLDVGEGQHVVTTVMLDGDAPTYPVTVSFTVSGSAVNPDDHNLAAGTVVISNGRTGTIVFDTAKDSVAESSETVVITLTSATHAVVGPRAAQTINIVEANEAPMVDVSVAQGGTTGAFVAKTGGAVTATALVSDPNPGDTHTFDWSLTDSGLTATNGTDKQTFQFDPAAVAAGAYQLKVKVTDGGGLVTSRSETIVVRASAPTLGAGDANGNGKTDAMEGAGDTDGDGIANYLDKNTDRELLPLEAPSSTSNRSLETEAGLRLALGAAALAANGTHAEITQGDATNFGDGGKATSAQDPGFAHNYPFFDFVVEGAAPGDSVVVVIPLSIALPSGTLSYRKISGTKYVAFVEGAQDSVSSAAAINGVCPLPRSSAYTAGLGANRGCVQLMIRDGGPNDLDGLRDGRVVDPGTIATAVAAPPSIAPVDKQSGGGGGCTVSNGPADPTLGALAVFALLYFGGRYQRRVQVVQRLKSDPSSAA